MQGVYGVNNRAGGVIIISVKLLIIVTVAAAAFGVYYFEYSEPQPFKVGDLEVMKVVIRDKTIEAEIADNLITRKQGLSGRESLTEDQGMLFIYSEPGSYSFWMRDMKFAIDIIWVSEDYKIIDITKNISPNTFPQTLEPISPAKYVLEVKANWADRNFIKVGDLVSF